MKFNEYDKVYFKMSEENNDMNSDEGYAVPLKDRTIHTQASDPPISDLCDRITKGRLEVQAEFQRNYVWETKAELRSKLIESVLLKVPIPVIYTLQKWMMGKKLLLMGNKG